MKVINRAYEVVLQQVVQCRFLFVCACVCVCLYVCWLVSCLVDRRLCNVIIICICICICCGCCFCSCCCCCSLFFVFCFLFLLVGYFILQVLLLFHTSKSLSAFDVPFPGVRFFLGGEASSHGCSVLDEHPHESTTTSSCHIPSPLLNVPCWIVEPCVFPWFHVGFFVALSWGLPRSAT